MITKEYLQQELVKRIDGYKRGVETTTDNIIAEMKSIIVLVDALPDYEKKYNEALERAKKFAIDDAYASQGVIAKLIFPELRESEDERIRKALIDALKVSETIGELKFRLPYPTREECIAYLEKQKESLHVQETCKENADSFTSEDERIRKEIIDFLETIPASELKRIPRPISEWFAWLEKQKVKVYDDTPYYTPEEVNAKIEKPIDVIPKIPRQEYLYHLLANGVITFSDYEFLMRNKGRKPADLSEMMVHKEPYIAPVPTPMVADEQKPAEWSNGKSILEDIIVFVSGYADKRVVAKWVSFLKSLRPQLKYEWSEEERKILDSIIDDYEKAARSFCGYDGKIGLLRAIRDGEYNLPKPAWSEEDEKIMESLISLIETIGEYYISLETIDRYVAWLKSLRPSWKPSEQDELMKLKYAGTSTKLD